MNLSKTNIFIWLVLSLFRISLADNSSNGILTVQAIVSNSDSGAASHGTLHKASASFVDYLSSKVDTKRNIAKEERKKNRLTSAMQQFGELFHGWKPEVSSANHTRSNQAIFTTAISPTYGCSTARHLVGSIRKTGFIGDIVVSVLPTSSSRFLDCLREHGVVLYIANMKCEGHDVLQRCELKEVPGLVAPVSIFRYYFYVYWATKYSADTVLMLTDFRDVFFQSNPFEYRRGDWYPPNSDLVLFQENYPLKVIYRDVLHESYLKNCYGDMAMHWMGSNPVLVAGMLFGTSSAVTIYGTMILQQLDPRARFGSDFNSTAYQSQPVDKCMHAAMDQGFHNWVYYSGQLAKMMDVKVFQQGEGPVNSIGAFAGHRALIKRTLSEWTILRGEAGEKTVHNWNGDRSPVVHQSDRFLSADLAPTLEKHFSFLRKN